jgi:hypothetical protein
LDVEGSQNPISVIGCDFDGTQPAMGRQAPLRATELVAQTVQGRRVHPRHRTIHESHPSPSHTRPNERLLRRFLGRIDIADRDRERAPHRRIVTSEEVSEIVSHSLISNEQPSQASKRFSPNHAMARPRDGGAFW